jgi:hypothetical protein
VLTPALGWRQRKIYLDQIQVEAGSAGFINGWIGQQIHYGHYNRAASQNMGRAEYKRF